MSDNGDAVVRLDHVSKSFGDKKVLDDVSFAIPKGKAFCLLGRSGTGKSVTLRHIIGLVRPDRGRVALSIDGVAHDLATLSPEAIVDLGVALVPEGRRLFPKLTVTENLMLGAFRKMARNAIQQNLALVFDTFPVLKERRNQLAGTMSGGQQQMLAIARALMSSPRLLLVDEPSVGLSPLLVSQTIAKIGELNQNLGLTVLMAEQNFNQAIRIASRGYIIVHGEIVVAAKSVDELKGNDIVKRLYLGGVV
jgi:branched-chain amino acid transport system ATP-binding protein